MQDVEYFDASSESLDVVQFIGEPVRLIRAGNREMRLRSLSYVAIVSALIIARPAIGDEQACYKYDALGRLINTAYVFGPRDGQQTGLNYDPAGNRKRYVYAPGTTCVLPTSAQTISPITIQSQAAAAPQKPGSGK